MNTSSSRMSRPWPRWYEQHQPAAILFGVTNYGRDVAARLAARLGLGLEYNVSEVSVDGGSLVMTVPAFGGSQSVKATFKGDGTKLIGARSNAFPTNRVGGAAEVVAVPAAGGSGEWREAQRPLRHGGRG